MARVGPQRPLPQKGDNGRSQWPRGLRRRSAAALLLRLCVRIPPGAWMFVCFECCVLSGRSLCDGLITRPMESYRLWCVVVCDLETSSRMRRPWPALGCSAIGGGGDNDRCGYLETNRRNSQPVRKHIWSTTCSNL
jgi:hypothetical protein